MAIDDAAEGAETGSESTEKGPPADGSGDGPGARVGEYSWVDFLEASDLVSSVNSITIPGEADDPPTVEWDAVPFDPVDEFGIHPERATETVTAAATDGKRLQSLFDEFLDPETTPVRQGEYLWEHFKQEYYYLPDGSRPRDDEGGIVPFVRRDHLGFDPAALPSHLSLGGEQAHDLAELVEERTVNVNPELDEDAFFSTVDGQSTIVSRYDLEKAVPMEKKRHFREVERYWVNKPYAFVIIFHSEKENEKKYYLVEPHLTPVETQLQEFLTEKLRMAIKYAESDVAVEGSEGERREVIERETMKLLRRYDLYSGPVSEQRGTLERLIDAVDREESEYAHRAAAYMEDQGWYTPPEGATQDGIEGMSVRPEPVLIEEDAETLTQYQVEKLLYVLKRNFIGYERIDGIKHDINVEDISVDGYNSPVFVYHTDYEQLITNIEHGRQQLDDFVVKLAQRSGKGISKRQPQVDATLPDGSRAQLTLGEEVSDHGTNYTIRQFKEIPFTPVDLVNWKTFSLREMAFLWLAIENNKSLMFAGGTASGKTTSLNAVSLFVPSNAKIVSIEDTREVELPQRNWIASVTRPSFGEDERGDIDEFDLLEAALRQRPDYIIMGEIRGEEGRTLFQVMSTGHTTYTTFHADNVSEVIKRFTTEPINVSKTLFTALDLISIQTSTRVRGQKVRRSRELTEIRRYDPENDEINVNDVFQWRPETDSYRHTAESTTLEEIQFDRGWSDEELDRQLDQREAVLAYLIVNGLNTYSEVAATVQAYINDPSTILTLIANDTLEAALEDLRQMESVLIDVDAEKEEMVPRPDPGEDTLEHAKSILETADGEIFDDFRGEQAPDISDVLDIGVDDAEVNLTGDDERADEWDTSEWVPASGDDDGTSEGSESTEEEVTDADVDSTPNREHTSDVDIDDSAVADSTSSTDAASDTDPTGDESTAPSNDTTPGEFGLMAAENVEADEDDSGDETTTDSEATPADGSADGETSTDDQPKPDRPADYQSTPGRSDSSASDETESEDTDE